LFPWAIQRFDLSAFDLVISCSHAVAKGAVAGPGAANLCYCLTPMRYIWDMFTAYQERSMTPQRDQLALRILRKRLQRWDRESSRRIKDFAAISKFVAERIHSCYGREAQVIYPPIDTQYFTPDPQRYQRSDYFLLVSALVPYKRVDLIIQVFNTLRVPLWIVGEGPLEATLRKQAGPSIRFLGRLSDHDLRELYRRAKALVFAAREEFGIAPLEAQACGTPVIGYREGGLKETILDGTTGILYSPQEPEALAQAIIRFPKKTFAAHDACANAQRFSQERFLSEFSAFVNRNTRGKAF
jgi:glycosyltransferase involved in cell wall biosynthesis